MHFMPCCRITFDTPVSELLGVGYEFPDDFQTRETTIKDVLSHRTGIAALNLAMLFGIPPGISREDFSKYYTHVYTVIITSSRSHKALT